MIPVGGPPALPLMVRLSGRRVVGVGGGPVAAAKLRPLALEHRAQLHVVAPHIDSALEGIATWSQREYGGPEDLEGAALVVAATGTAEVNAQVAADAETLRIWCVRTDAGGAATADFPATVRRGALTIAVGTSGQSPTVARWLRADLEQRYGPEYGDLVDLLGELRRDPVVQHHLAGLPNDGRRRAWRSIPLVDILDLLRTGSVDSAKEVAAACLSSFSD